MLLNGKQKSDGVCFKYSEDMKGYFNMSYLDYFGIWAYLHAGVLVLTLLGGLVLYPIISMYSNYTKIKALKVHIDALSQNIEDLKTDLDDTHKEMFLMHQELHSKVNFLKNVVREML